MADGIDVTPGSGKKVATDERTIGGVTQDVQRVGEIGSGTAAVGQVTISNTSAAIAAARDTRKRIIIINYQSVPIFVDPGATATTADLRLNPGDSITLYTTAAVNAITAAAYTASGDAKVHYIEEYD